MRVLYVSPTARGGVDIGIQNILRSVRRTTVAQAELLNLPELYNFAPFLIHKSLPSNWHAGFDVIQGRSRVGFALRVEGKPLITTVHHLTTEPALQLYSSIGQRIFYRLFESRYDRKSIFEADMVVCVSRYVQEQVLRTYGFKNTVVIYDGIDTDFFVPNTRFLRREDGLPPSDARIRLLFIGNNTYRKGFDLLPQIISRLPRDYTLYYNSGFQSASNRLIHPRMIPIGVLSRSDLVAAYQSCDILLFPSRLEGFGIVAAEALACGRPVVTTNVSALPEVVDHGSNGFLCTRDNIPSYVDAITILGEDAKLRQRFGEHGREKVMSAFSYNQLGERFVKLYQKLLDREQ